MSSDNVRASPAPQTEGNAPSPREFRSEIRLSKNPKSVRHHMNLLTISPAESTCLQKPRKPKDHVKIEREDIGTKELIECIVIEVRPVVAVDKPKGLCPGDHEVELEYRLQLLPGAGGKIVQDGAWLPQDRLFDAN